ncbi:hypothetical protein DXG01_005730 [Tephrocybe rancida]|nr:hypothetical protein DXG01_005730 [Tephrocybe rancida]
MVARTFRASLILDTVRELDRILSVPPVTSSHDLDRGVDAKQYPRTRPERVKKLATKDTLWYLCTILQVLCGKTCDDSAIASQPMTVPVASEGRGKKKTRKEAGEMYEIQGGGAQLLSEGISDTLLQLITRMRPLSRLNSGTGIEAQREVARSGPTPRGNADIQPCTISPTVEGRGKAGPRGAAHGDINRDESGSRMLPERTDVGTDADAGISVNAAGHPTGESGSDQCAGSVPQAINSRHHSRHDHGVMILDDVGYGMLLGVLERYWVWSRSWEL